MKRIFIGIGVIALLVAAFSSCSKNPLGTDEIAPAPTRSMLSEREANRIIFENIRITPDSLLMLYLTRQEAAEMGISSEIYAKAIENIDDTNEHIIGFRNQYPDKYVGLETFEHSERSVVYSANALLPSGTLVTSGQEEASAGFQAPHEQVGVNFLCRSNVAPTCVYTCKTYSLANWRIETKAGSSFANTNVRVPLAASNVWASAHFSTTDPNGGSAYYTGY